MTRAQAGAGAVSLALHSLSAIGQSLPGPALDWLGAAERLRLSGITAPRRRAQFIAGRWLARQSLARRAGGCWRDYALSAPDCGAPQLLAWPAQAGAAQWHFSLSHSGDWLACAVAPYPVGVDVECCTRVRDFQALNGWLHTPAALHGWAARTAQQQQAWFYAQWALKEAWFKQTAAARPAVPAAVPALSALRAAQFTRCKAENSSAMLGQNRALVLALCPATPERLHWQGGAPLQSLDWSCWRHTAATVPQRERHRGGRLAPDKK